MNRRTVLTNLATVAIAAVCGLRGGKAEGKPVATVKDYGAKTLDVPPVGTLYFPCPKRADVGCFFSWPEMFCIYCGRGYGTAEDRASIYGPSRLAPYFSCLPDPAPPC